MQIRGWPARKHPLHQGHQAGGRQKHLPCKHHPFAPLGGLASSGGWSWGQEGWCSALPFLHPLRLTPAVPSFLSAIQTVHTAKQGAEGQGWGDVHSGRARGVCKRGSEDVLLIKVAPGLFTGFWESWGGGCCYGCWWDLKVLWCEPCRTGEEMLGNRCLRACLL